VKIAFVLDDTLDTNDGVQQYVRLVGDWMNTQGHEVHYLTGETKRNDIANLYSLSKNVKVSFNKNKMSIPLPARTGSIKQLLAREQYDVLHVQMPFSPQLSAKIIHHKSPNTACVATFHIAPHSQFVTKANKLLATFQKQHLRHIDRVISVSTVAQKFAKEAYKLTSTVIPNAISTHDWKPPKKHVKNHGEIVFVGRLVARKGAIYVLQALTLLRSHGIVNYSLCIAGDGPEREKLEAFTRRNNLSSQVEFLGFVSEDKKKQLLQTADLAVYPATGGESFGIVLLEAMAAGTVVLAGNNPGYSSVLASCPDALFNPRDPQLLATTMRHVLEDRTAYRALLSKQQNIIKNFDIDIVGNAILREYNQAIKSKEHYAQS
jgi:phosphatidylinositol alpha-mannosyltransferase